MAFQPDASPQQSSSPGDNKGARKPVQIGDTFETKRLDTPLDKMTRERAGKRSYTRHGPASAAATSRRAWPTTAAMTSPSTPRCAPPFQRQRKEEAVNDLALQLRTGDLQRKIRVRRTGNLILFAVDARRWSMAASERMEATKGAIFSLLVDVHQRRDRVWAWSSSSGTRRRWCCRRPVRWNWPRRRCSIPGRQDAADFRPLPRGRSSRTRRRTPNCAAAHPAHRRRGNVSMTGTPAVKSGRIAEMFAPTCAPSSSTWSTPPLTAAWPRSWPMRWAASAITCLNYALTPCFRR
ncbi:MAG: hypothetical protein R2854_30710 [Caldilineaceae bacterium]